MPFTTDRMRQWAVRSQNLRNRGWIKVKCHAWRGANADRGELSKKS